MCTSGSQYVIIKSPRAPPREPSPGVANHCPAFIILCLYYSLRLCPPQPEPELYNSYGNCFLCKLCYCLFKILLTGRDVDPRGVEIAVPQ